MDLPGTEGRDEVNVALRPEHLNILSICTGGAGLDLGVELAIPSARTVCMVEREGFAVATLASAMEAGILAPAPIWSDARTFDGRAWRGAVDGVIGGIPCQPHSLAGRKRGSHDERDLWSDARRIIVQSRARLALIENVSGMLAAGDDEIAGAERVHRDLCKLGFAVEGGLFKAREVGTSHQRERLFILGVADSDSEYDDGPWIEWPGRRRQSANGSRQLADSFSERRCSGHREWEDAADAHPASQENVLAMDNAVSDGRRARRVNYRSDVWNQPSSTGQHDMADAAGNDQWREREWSPGPGSDELQTGGHSCGIPAFPPGPAQSDEWIRVLRRSPELEPAFRRVADGLASRMDIGRVDRLRMLGNGVVPLQAAYAIRTLSTRLASRGSAGAARLVRMMEMPS